MIRETEKITKALNAKRLALIKTPHRREEIAVINSGDEMERLQLASDRDVMVHSFENDSAILTAVEEALERFRDGEYGICQLCDQEISPKRLQAVPWAAFCVSCQEKIERSQRAESGAAEAA